jgi:hypothetical protein
MLFENTFPPNTPRDAVMNVISFMPGQTARWIYAKGIRSQRAQAE